MSKRTRRMLEENNRLEQGLSEEGRQALTELVVYLRSSGISPYDQELVRRDFTEMLLEGERRGLPPREVIGPDYQSFCDSVIAEVPGLSGRARLLTPLRDILLCAAVLLGIRLAFRCVDWLLGVEQWPCLTVTLGDAVSAGLILAGAFLLFAVLANGVFRAGWASGRNLSCLLFALILGCSTALSAFVRLPLFRLHGLAVLAALIVLLAAYKWMDAKLD